MEFYLKKELWLEDLQAKIRDIIRSTVILANNDKDNIMILKATKQLFQDEARAYRVGGLNARKHLNLKKGCTKSEMYSTLYEEVIVILDEEIKLQKKNRLRKLSKKPQIDYHVDTQPSSFLDVFAQNLSKGVENKKSISVDDFLKNLE